MTQQNDDQVKKSPTIMRIGGASIAWITLYGALCGVTALIPFFPYVGGGGYLPLLIVFTSLAPVILGPVGGIVAGLIGGIIGMFIAPAAFPLQLVDALLVAALPSVFVAITLNTDKRNWFTLGVVICILAGLFGAFFPYWVPGESAGFGKPPNQWFYWGVGSIFWLLPLILIVSPLLRKTVASWVQGEDRKFKYLGFFIAIATANYLWFFPLCLPYWYVFQYEPSVASATFFAYTWWMPLLGLTVSIIAVPLVEALKRSGLPKIQGALW